MKPDSASHNQDPAYLRGLREAAGIRQAALAARLGISRRMVQYYEAEEGTDGHRAAPYLYQYAVESLIGSGG